MLRHSVCTVDAVHAAVPAVLVVAATSTPPAAGPAVLFMRMALDAPAKKPPSAVTYGLESKVQLAMVSVAAAVAVGVTDAEGDVVDEASDDTEADALGTCDVPTVAVAKAVCVDVGDGRGDGVGRDVPVAVAVGNGVKPTAKTLTSSRKISVVDVSRTSMRSCTMGVDALVPQAMLGNDTEYGANAVER